MAAVISLQQRQRPCGASWWKTPAAKQRLKHGGGLQRAHLTTLDVAISSQDENLLAVNDALDKLAAHYPLGAQLIKLRFFAGLPNVEAARVLGIPERTAKRTWAYARAWLYEELKKTL